MGNKRLAIDSSIWLYQFQLAIRDQEGRALANAHILGFLRRITKLLFYGIKPVFVFDGGAPKVKKMAISERKKRKRGGAENLARTAEKLLAAQMRQQAVMEAQKRQLQNDTGALITEDTVFLNDLPVGVAARGAVQGSSLFHGDSQPPPAKRKKYVHQDAYALPELQESIQDRANLQDPRLATEEELRDFIEEMKPEDFDVDSEWFNNLSTEVKYEIIGDLRIKSRQPNHKRVENMRQSVTALDFSKAQIKHLMQRNDLTQKLLTVTDDISKAHISIPIRIASERSKHYVLIKTDASQGGGWSLGVRDLKGAGTKDAPVQVDTTASESETDEPHTSEEEFDAVPIPVVPKMDSSPQSNRKTKVIDVIERRYSPKKFRKPLSLDENEDLWIDQRPLFERPEMEEILEAAQDDPELWQDIVDAHQPETAAPVDSEDDTMFEEVPAPSLQPADSSSRPTTSFSPSLSIQDRLKGSPATSLAQAVAGRPYRRIDEDISIPAVEDEEELDQGPSLVAAALVAYSDSDSDESHEEVALTSPFSAMPLAPPSNTSPVANGTIGELTSPPPLRRPPRNVQAHVASPQASTSKQTLDFVPFTSSTSFPQEQSGSPLPEATGNEPKTITPVEDDGRPAFKKGSSEQAIAESVLMQEPRSNSDDPSLTTIPPSTRTPEAVHVRERDPSPDWEEEATALPPRHSGSDWSRAPSPAQQPGPDEVPEDFPLLEPGHELSEEEMDAGDKEDLAMAVNVQDETARFSKFLNELQSRNLDQVRGEVEAEITQLRGQQKKDRRDAEDITQQMSKDIQGMLRLFGLPFVVAPMEAEAQCAELQRLSLVDGIITDDSDVFLFNGGTKVYKNLFNQAKYVELYQFSDISRELGLQREDLINLGYLLGSDYTAGIKGVGPVGALDIMREFGTLSAFRDWWCLVQKGKDTADVTDTAFKRSFKKAQLKKGLFLDESWPDPEVKEAYDRPEVDKSVETFFWGIPDLDGLRSYLSEHLGWATVKVDDLLMPLIKRMRQRSQGVANMQGTLDGFFDTSVGAGKFQRSKHAGSSARMQKVISAWKASQRQNTEGGKTVDDLLEPARSRSASPVARTRKPQKCKASTETATKAKKPRKPRKATAGDLVETDPSDAPDEPSLPARSKPTRRAARKANYRVQDSSDNSE